MNWKQALKDYQHYLKLERGLSQNSISNYVLDIKKLIVFIETHKLKESPTDIDRASIQRFVY